MIKGVEKRKDILDKDIIFKFINDENIYNYYLNNKKISDKLDIKKFYPSPFRLNGDENPNLRFFLSGDEGKERLLFKDFASNQSGDSISFIMELLNLNYPEALKRIYLDFEIENKINKTENLDTLKNKNQINNENENIKRIKNTLIQIIPRDFTKEELNYWKEYYITKEELNLNNIYSEDRLYLNKKLIRKEKKIDCYYNSNYRFAYLYDQYLKIYTPYSKNNKWLSNTPNDFISGFDDIKYKIFRGIQDEKLIISKSKKDEIVLKKFFKDVCSTQNESVSSINEENLDIIRKGYKKENIFIAYDSDAPGVKASKHYTDAYGFKWVNPPRDLISQEGIKDFAEMIKYKGENSLYEYFKSKNLIKK